MIQSPQTFVIRQECDKAAFQNGFRRPQNENAGWSSYTSTTAQGTLWLASDGGENWFFALDHAGVVNELGVAPSNISGPGLARFQFPNLTTLYEILPRLYQLAVSLPDAPLQEFQRLTEGMPRTTEAERLTIQRIGQNIFRDRLSAYWQGRCPLTGITDTELLRASHIQPCKDCPTDTDRLDIHNGLLLSALWDAAFDRGLVTFDKTGKPIFSERLSTAAREQLKWTIPIQLTDGHLVKLQWHRENVFC